MSGPSPIQPHVALAKMHISYPPKDSCMVVTGEMLKGGMA